MAFRNSERARNCSSPKFVLTPGSTQPCIQWVQGVLLQDIKQPGLKVEHSLPPSAKLKKE